MSYILEALKKSETDRELGDIPKLSTRLSVEEVKKRALWPWFAGGGVLSVNAVVLAVLFWPQEPAPLPLVDAVSAASPAPQVEEIRAVPQAEEAATVDAPPEEEPRAAPASVEEPIIAVTAAAQAAEPTAPPPKEEPLVAVMPPASEPEGRPAMEPEPVLKSTAPAPFTKEPVEVAAVTQFPPSQPATAKAATTPKEPRATRTRSQESPAKPVPVVMVSEIPLKPKPARSTPAAEPTRPEQQVAAVLPPAPVPAPPPPSGGAAGLAPVPAAIPVFPVIPARPESSISEYAVAYFNRGWAYAQKLRYDKAIEDYSQAIRIDLKYADAYFARGWAHEKKGAYGNAIKDYSQAIEMKPDYALAYNNRGVLKLHLNEYETAALDFAAAYSLSDAGLRPYSLLWLYLSRVRSGVDGKQELAEKAGGIDLARWPGVLVSLFLGRATQEEVLAAAMKGANAGEQREKLCVAFFYLGQHHLLQGDKEGAIRLFKKALGTGVTTYIQYGAAREELKRLGAL